MTARLRSVHSHSLALWLAFAGIPIHSLGADPIPTFLSVAVEPSPLTPGDAIRLVVTVTPPVSGSAFAASGPSPSQGSAAVTNGSGTIVAPPREPGTYSYYVEFRPSNPAYASASTNVTVQVSAVQPSVSTPELVAGTPRVGETVTLRTFVFPYPPNASVRFLDGGKTLASSPVVNWGAQVPVTGFGQVNVVFQSVGDHSIRAVFDGVSGYSAAESGALSLVIRGALSFSLRTSGSPASTSSPITIRAEVGPRSQGVIPSGSVTLSDGSVSYGRMALDGSGAAAWTLPAGSLSPGAHTLRASYGGDAYYDEAASTVLQQVRGTPIVALTASANSILATQAVTMTANVSPLGPGSPTPSGEVTLLDNFTNLGVAKLDGSGTGRWTLAAGALTPGEHLLRVSYAGDSSHDSASSNVVRLQVNSAASPTATQLSVGLQGGGVQLLAGVTGGEVVATGAVVFRDMQSNQTYRAVLAQGVATVGDATPSLGHFVEAAYEGDATHAASKSVLQQVLALLNGFSFARADLAPDEIVTIFGGGLALSQQSASVPLPAVLGGSSAVFTDRTGASHVASWYFASPGQATVVVPSSVPPGAGELTLTGAGGEKFRVTLQVVAAAPGMATANADGQGPPAGQLQRVRADGSVAFESLAAFDAAAGKWTPAPIEFRGDQLYLVLYGTGFRHASPVTCRVRGELVPVLYAGAQGAYPRLDQVNLALPEGFNGAGSVEVNCVAGSVASNSVSLLLR